MIYLYRSKINNISTNLNHNGRLNLLFYKEGFSYCIDDGKSTHPSVFDFKVSQNHLWETELIREIEINLRLRRNFDSVKATFLSPFFSLFPAEYSDEPSDVLLNFSEAEFENNQLLKSETGFGAVVVYGTSQLLSDKLKALYPNIEFSHSAKVFLDSVQNKQKNILHLNLNFHQLEIAVCSEDQLLFYNLFDTPSGEDILFYTLFVIEQLALDANAIEVKTYGELQTNTKVFQVLKKYIRHLNQALKDEISLKNFLLYNLSKCELSQVHSEEKK